MQVWFRAGQVISGVLKECWEPVTQRHSVTSQKTLVLSQYFLHLAKCIIET